MTLHKWADSISEELAGAENYASMYHDLKDNMPEDAEAYREMAEQEMEHADKLCDMACEHMDDMHDDMNPAQREMAWNWEKARIKKRMDNIRTMLHE